MRDKGKDGAATDFTALMLLMDRLKKLDAGPLYPEPYYRGRQSERPNDMIDKTHPFSEWEELNDNKPKISKAKPEDQLKNDSIEVTVVESSGS